MTIDNYGVGRADGDALPPSVRGPRGCLASPLGRGASVDKPRRRGFSIALSVKNQRFLPALPGGEPSGGS